MEKSEVLSKQKLIFGDCLPLLKKMDDKSVDFTFTSPPYNRKRNDKYSHYEDIVENYFEWISSVIDECLRITKNHVFLNIQTNYYNRQDVYKLYGKYYGKIVEVIIWEKTNPMPASGLNITNAVEYFIVFGDTPLKSNSTYTKNIVKSSVHSSMPKNHKAVMKPEIADYFIENFTKEKDMGLDPFAGIGTTGISCKKYGRNFIGFEKTKEYYEMAKKNLER